MDVVKKQALANLLRVSGELLRHIGLIFHCWPGSVKKSAVDCRRKLIQYENLEKWREHFARQNQRLVVTNGCFDLLHTGHVNYLEAARNQGDFLLVGVNSDQAVRELKGPGRPLNSQGDRSVVIAALEAVDGVCVFPEVDAQVFLRKARPDIYVKGGDYTLETINQEERRLIEGMGGRIVLIGFVPGKSTTAIVQKLAG